MPEVLVLPDVLRAQMVMLGEANKQIDQTRKAILSQYQRLSVGWNDGKYRTLGDIVQESSTSLLNIQQIFQRSQKVLGELYRAAMEYEQTNFYAGSGTEDGLPGMVQANCQGRMCRETLDECWRVALESIEVQIGNYREALTQRGVPDCRWLNETLQQHRVAMLQQESYNLEETHGQGQNGQMLYRYPEDYAAFYDSLANQFCTHCVKTTNPNFSSGLPQWRINCQRCVPVHEMLRRGHEVTVRPSTYGGEYLTYHPFAVWRNPDILWGQGDGRADIEEALEGWGDGARAQVVVLWDIPHGGGHTFLAERRNGVTVFTDAQSGTMDASSHFDQAREGSVQFCRIDNLEFSDYLEVCYEEV